MVTCTFIFNLDIVDCGLLFLRVSLEFLHIFNFFCRLVKRNLVSYYHSIIKILVITHTSNSVIQIAEMITSWQIPIYLCQV